MLVLNGSATIADVVALADRREQVSVSPATVAACQACTPGRGGPQHSI